MLRKHVGVASFLVGILSLLIGGLLIWLPASKSGNAGFDAITATTTVPSIGARSKTPSFEPIIDYSDPVGRARVPLTYVEGRRHELISETVRVWEVASKDGAPYARISKELVSAIDALRARTDAEILVLSGYRHLLRNALDEIGGARESRHVAGLAADLRSDDLTPLELAELILDVAGCEVGLGLGVMSVHFDLRGFRSVWSRPGADMEPDAFAQWVSEVCGDEPALTDEDLGVDELDETDVDAIPADQAQDEARKRYEW